ncbi:MAG: signal peptidase I [Bacilli bacterium]|nr:signal peptidase I [Bacilli bacterium]
MKKVFGVCFDIIKYLYLMMLIIYLVFICIHRISIDNSIFGYRLFTINNNEMYPKYKVNDIVIVEDVDNSKLKVGDDISYIGDCCGQGGMTINHQIIKIDNEENKIITKGINSPIEDPEIKYKQVIGKIVGILPGINFLHHILKNQIGFFVVVFLPIVITVIVLIIKTIKDIKIEKEELKEKTNKKEDIEIL